MICEEESIESKVGLTKVRTGIAGLDEITHGGLPAGRPTLVYGGPGCGKTILAMEFLVRGARDFGEPGLFVSFEENVGQLVENFHSIGFDLDRLVEQKKLKIAHVDLFERRDHRSRRFYARCTVDPAKARHGGDWGKTAGA